MIKRYLAIILAIYTLSLTAQPPVGYYSSAIGKTGAQLKTTLHGIISEGYVQQEYSFLYTIFRQSDITPDGKVWDMYSHCSWTYGIKQCGNYSSVCDCYNREHSIPASWFNDRYPMFSDVFTYTLPMAGLMVNVQTIRLASVPAALHFPMAKDDLGLLHFQVTPEGFLNRLMTIKEILLAPIFILLPDTRIS